MIDALVYAFAVILAYLIGSFPTAFLVTKFVKGVDIREHGSQNVGATNVTRVAGKLPGIITLIVDILKGVIVVTLVAHVTYRLTSTIDEEFYYLSLGAAAIIGHVWPVFLQFKGGKGVATTIGIMAIVAPLVLVPGLALWVIVFALTNFVSLASIIMGVAFPIIALATNQSIYMIIFTVFIALLNTYKHRSNIKRLIKREEHKTYLGKRP